MIDFSKMSLLCNVHETLESAKGSSQDLYIEYFILNLMS